MGDENVTMDEPEMDDDVESSDAVIESAEDSVVDSSLSSKEEERRRLQADIDAFLNNGGSIDRIEPNVIADPPKKPSSNYGGQPI